ncbi:hypothetical protein BKA56DRAFT_606585, partial [Ilyonectria sp. MPI-CAGE-AT-0026]
EANLLLLLLLLLLYKGCAVFYRFSCSVGTLLTHTVRAPPPMLLGLAASHHVYYLQATVPRLFNELCQGHCLDPPAIHPPQT